MSSQAVNIKVSFDVSLENRGDHWAALIEQTGTTVYAESEQAALKRADEMIGFMASCFEKHSTLSDFRQYLDKRGIQHSVEMADAPNGGYAPLRRYRREEAIAFA